MRTAVLALLCNTAAQAQTLVPQLPVPRELEGWQSWVQYGQEFRRCPYFANTDGSRESNRICAWPGRLNLEFNQGGGRFTQTWVSYSEAWIPLPGNVEHWPSAATVNGAAALGLAEETGQLAAGLSADEVVTLHAGAGYDVRFIGFLPGFPYLAGLPERLETPRRQTPRAHVPAGSVAIAGAQAGIYPVASPAGWNVIGRTDFMLFDPRREKPVTLASGDRVRFRAIGSNV
jgi:hypothetical protein